MKKKPFSGMSLRLAFGIVAALFFLVFLVGYFVLSSAASLPQDNPSYGEIPPFIVALVGNIAIITGVAALVGILFGALAKKGRAANWISLACSVLVLVLALSLGLSLGNASYDGALGEQGQTVLILSHMGAGLLFGIPLFIGSIMGIRYGGKVARGEYVEQGEGNACQTEERTERVGMDEVLAKGTVPEGESEFIGNGLELWGWSLLGTLVSIVTCGICLPVAVNWIYRYKAEHTVVSGRRLCWHGTAGGLFWNWIKWLLLTIVTCGIYGIWVEKRLLQWKARNTSYEGCPAELQDKGNYDGGIFLILLVRLVSLLLTIITCGIYSPWAFASITRYQMEHTQYAGMRLGFKGTGGGYFLTWLKTVLLSLITCGLYAFIKAPVLCWIAENTYFERAE